MKLTAFVRRLASECRVMKDEALKGKDVMDRAKLSFIPCVGNLCDFLLEKILHFSVVTLDLVTPTHTSLNAFSVHIRCRDETGYTARACCRDP